MCDDSYQIDVCMVPTANWLSETATSRRLTPSLCLQVRRAATAAARPMGAFSTGVPVDWGLSQRPAHVDWGLSYTTGQATIVARLWLVEVISCFEVWNLGLLWWLSVVDVTLDLCEKNFDIRTLIVYIDNSISICLAVFAQIAAECPCTLWWAAPSPL